MIETSVPKARRLWAAVAAMSIVASLVATSGIATTSTLAAGRGVVSSARISVAQQQSARAYWTKERMAAAKPYPMPRAKGTPGTAAAPAATGPAAEIAGTRPPGAPKPLAEPAVAGAKTVEPQANNNQYPFPFTRYFVDPAVYNAPGMYAISPYITIGKLFFNQPGGSFVCSASSVTSAPFNAIWTAGHCLSNGAGAYSTSVVFVPSYRNGVRPYGNFTCTQLWTSSAWHTTGDFARDLGACTVGTNASGQTLQSLVGSLGFAYNQSRTKHFNAFGYPQAAPFNGAYMVTCQASHAVDDTGSGQPAPIGIGCDMTGGSSGGPWVIGFHNPVGFINGHNDYKYISPPQPLAMYSPYFDTLADQIRCGAATGSPTSPC